VDYLLASPHVTIHYVGLCALPECRANAEVEGTIPCPGFGASDCRSGCGSHLRYLGAGLGLWGALAHSGGGL